MNALHPFREGNGRAQREFARLVCFECGYDFNLSCATHKEMLEASKLSFNIGDSSAFVKIFSKAISPHCEDVWNEPDVLSILTSDDLIIGTASDYDYYGYNEHENAEAYDNIYKEKISKMDAEEILSDKTEFT